MEEFDIRDRYVKKKKEANRKTISEIVKLHKSGKWFALKAIHTKAYGFRKILKRSKKLGDKWYTGYSLIFTQAVSSCNKLHSIKVPRSGWTTLKIKCYNHQDWCNYETIKHLK